jgi:glycosyltransferase involved in cell wall biosynthesis
MVGKTHYVFVRRTHGFGGVENRLIDWLGNVDFEKADVTIITHVDVFSNELKKSNIPVRVITTSLGKEFSLVNIKAWYDLLKRYRPDAVIFMQGDFFDIPWFLFVIGKIIHIKKIYLTEHLAVKDPPIKKGGFYFKVIPRLHLWWYWKIYSNGVRGYLANKVLAVSEGVKEKLILWKYPKDNIIVIKHGVDTNLFFPSSEGRMKFRSKHGIPEDAQVIISTARFEKQKRLERIVYSFNKLSDEYERLWLVFAGDGSLINDVKNLVTSNERVLFLGFMEKKSIAEALQGSDIFILPSDNEGFGIAVIEAMSTGLICIATKVPGPEDILQDGFNGFLSETSQEEIHRVLQKVLALDDREKMKVSENARNCVKKNYRKDIVIKEILNTIGIPIIAGVGQ